MSDPPVSALEPAQPLEEGTALCLSGGGYRAMLFHAGAIWRMNEFGLLSGFSRISSVSGGSITAAVLGVNWGQLSFGDHGVAAGLREALLDPLRGLARFTVDLSSIVKGIALPGSIAEKVVAAYEEHLSMRGKTLQDLPDSPRFIFNATNLQSRALWRFSKPYMGDYLIGRVMNPKVPLAQAVAASSAYPPVLSPLVLRVDPDSFSPPEPGNKLHFPPYTSNVVLSDGGVYDNLGLEPAWKRCRTILVSDAGAACPPQPAPRHDWISQTLRVLDIIDNQVRSLRVRQLVESYRSGIRKGTYWSIGGDIRDCGVTDALICPLEKTHALAEIETRLEKMDDSLQESLIDWGYAMADAAIRARVPGISGPSPSCPYGTFQAPVPSASPAHTP